MATAAARHILVETEAECQKLKDEIALTRKVGAQPWKKSSTMLCPAIVNMKQTTTLTTKAMTWLFVSDERQDPIERYAPANVPSADPNIKPMPVA